MHVQSSLAIRSARGEAGDGAAFRWLASARALWSTPSGPMFSHFRGVRPTGPVRTQLGGDAVEASPLSLTRGRVRSNLSDILVNDQPRRAALTGPYGYRRPA